MFILIYLCPFIFKYQSFKKWAICLINLVFTNIDCSAIIEQSKILKGHSPNINYFDTTIANLAVKFHASFTYSINQP